MQKKRPLHTSWSLIKIVSAFCVVCLNLTVKSALAQPCPGKDFVSFFAALLDKKELQKDFSYKPVVYRAFGAPVDAELFDFDNLPINNMGRILPKKEARVVEYEIKSYGKYVDVILNQINKSRSYIFTYEKGGSCWDLISIQEYE